MPRIIKPPDVSNMLSGASRRGVPLDEQNMWLLQQLVPGVQEFVIRANAEYRPWEKVKRLPMPSSLKPDQAWALIKLARRQAARWRTPFLDLKGEPFNFMLPVVAQRSLHHIDRRMGRSDRALSDAEKRIARALTEEAVSSSILEGAATTVADAKAFLAQKRVPRTKAERMVANNHRAMQHVKDIVQQPLTPDLLNELHAIITEGTLENPDQAGRFQRPGEKRVSVVDDRYGGDVVYVPPPAKEIPERINTVCQLANETDADNDAVFVHPVVRAILLHFAVAYIHPWADGNGRTARTVFYWSMLRQGYAIAEFLPISEIIRGQPVQYAQAFQHTEVDDGDATYFILYHLQVIDRALKALDDRVAREEEGARSGLNILRRFPDVNVRQYVLLRHALQHPHERYTFRGHAAYHAVVYQTARTDLLGLVDIGLLENLGGRPHTFVPVNGLREKLGVTD